MPLSDWSRAHFKHKFALDQSDGEKVDNSSLNIVIDGQKSHTSLGNVQTDSFDFLAI